MKCSYEKCDKTNIRARGLCVQHWNYEQYGSCSNGCILPAANSKGWCANCNKRGGAPKRRNPGTILNNEKERLCSRCKNVFPIDEFFKSHHKNRCQGCQSWVKRDGYLKRTYGIDTKTYEKMLEQNNGGCYICGKTQQENGKYLAVDHDHSCCSNYRVSCGKCVRGILCDPCNRAVGLLKDNAENAMAVAIYIKNNKPVDRKLLINLDW